MPYSEETKALARKIYYAGSSGRGVRQILGMIQNNVYLIHQKFLSLMNCIGLSVKNRVKTCMWWRWWAENHNKS